MGTLGKARESGTPSPATSRKIQLLIALVRRRYISLQQLQREFRISERTLLRDLQELRQIGSEAGFRIGERNGSDSVQLIEF
ncbi:MAG TPA: helix-turn-helix domain-containing protein [Candidatus Acidoferrales bacterium]|nr:helix-turn-helix domain-containing protein [Candidatus Acidoferrales bacterium]